MTNSDIEPSRFDTVARWSRTSDNQALALNRGRSTAVAPASRVAPSCMKRPLAWKSGMVT